jgi:hypothetical protein
MNHQIGTVTLHSQDKNRMLDFLSDVLEFDVDQNNDSVTHGPFVFQLSSDADISPLAAAGIGFTFRVKSEADLQEILRKYHFFLYRKPQTEILKETIRLSNDDHKKTLTIEDIDHRLWCFELHQKISEL